MAISENYYKKYERIEYEKKKVISGSRQEKEIKITLEDGEVIYIFPEKTKIQEVFIPFYALDSEIVDFVVFPHHKIKKVEDEKYKRETRGRIKGIIKEVEDYLLADFLTYKAFYFLRKLVDELTRLEI